MACDLTELIKQRLTAVNLNDKLVDLSKFVRSIQIAHNAASVNLRLPFYWFGLDSCLAQLFADQVVTFIFEYKIYTHLNSNKIKNLSAIKNIIAVGSGKGGVGKSTIAVNLALTLHRLGAKVGILDADIYGPSLPQLLSTQQKRPVITENKMIEPIMAFGIPTISIGNLIDANNAAIWRGPMVSSALQQLLFQTNWPLLDYLIIDLPPGTGDIQLTMAQKIPVTGALIVTTPQDVATIDAIKAVAMFTKVNIDVLGVVANMSYFVCNNCEERHLLFNNQKTVALSEKFNHEILAELPLVPSIAYQSEDGRPYMLAAELTAPLAQEFMALASKISYKLSQLPRLMHLPTAVVTQTV